MKASKTKPAKPSDIPVIPETMHHLRANPKAIAASGEKPKPEKRAKPFSKSRDTREDRGERQIKTTHNPQTFTHGK